VTPDDIEQIKREKRKKGAEEILKKIVDKNL